MNSKPRVLLTANYVPNEPVMGEDVCNLMSTRWARGHGDFQMDMYGHYFALYLLAENISNPTTVLESPHGDEFDRELDEGYDYVGFQLKSLHTKKIARMIRRIREKRPATKIMAGGYGVATLDNPVPGDVDGDGAYIRENADYLCRGEGVRFMRELLGDEPVEREITQYNVPMFSIGNILGTRGIHFRIPSILVSLGCPNGCDFCNTSAMYNRGEIYIAEPEQVYRYLKNFQKRMGFKEVLLMLWDEDFFINTEYVRELGRGLRSDKSTWSAKYVTFGSIRSLSQFSPEEIRDNGCEMVWIGVESFQCGADETDDTYEKRQGNTVKEVFEGLQRHGVSIIGSLCLGFDFHTKENLKDDLDQFVDLKSMFYQISHVLPCPGTALYDRLLEEGRILDSYGWDDVHFWSNNIYKYKNIGREDIMELFEYVHEKLRDINGPPTMQMLESQLDSYQILKDDKDPFHRVQAKRNRLFASGFAAFLHSIKTRHPREKVRERARMLEQRFNDEIGRPSLANRAVSRYISRNIKKKSKAPEAPVTSEPPPRWTYYNTYGDEVWVRKGREAKKPEPYKETGIVAGTMLTSFVEMLQKGRKNFKLLDNI